MHLTITAASTKSSYLYSSNHTCILSLQQQLHIHLISTVAITCILTLQQQSYIHLTSTVAIPCLLLQQTQTQTHLTFTAANTHNWTHPYTQRDKNNNMHTLYRNVHNFTIFRYSLNKPIVNLLSWNCKNTDQTKWERPTSTKANSLMHKYLYNTHVQ